MILNRVGKKTKIADKIISQFPKHDIFIEPFFGAGGITFNKSPSMYNFCNDIDNDVINVFNVLLKHRQELYDFIVKIPIHTGLVKFCRMYQPNNDIERAGLFLALSNYSYLGTSSCIHINTSNSKEILLKNIEKSYYFLMKGNFIFGSFSYEEFLKSISFTSLQKDKDRAFIYCDPPYIGTSDNYKNSFKQDDFCKLLDFLIEYKVRFAVSEFKNDITVNEAKNRGLNVIEICKRQTIKNTNIEILITNYEQKNTLF